MNIDAMDKAIFNILGIDIAQLRDTNDGFISTLKGVFEYEYVEALGIESRAPVYTCRDQYLPDELHNYTLDIEGQTNNFKIITPQPDGTGIVRLILEKI